MMAIPEGLEPPTNSLEGSHQTQVTRGSEGHVRRLCAV
jgi:hypothetical protein